MYKHLKQGSFHLHRNFLYPKVFRKLRSVLSTFKYKATYQPHRLYYGNRFQAYPCYEFHFHTYDHIFIPQLESIIKKKIDKKSFVCTMRKTIMEELKRSKVNTAYGNIHKDDEELAAVLYFDQTSSGGTVFFEHDLDKYPDISVGAYPNRLILYNAQRWHASSADYTFKERHVLLFFFNTKN